MNTVPFSQRHIGPDAPSTTTMLQSVGVSSLTDLIEKTAPSDIRVSGALDLPKALSEKEVLEYAWTLAKKNQLNKNFIGLGYYGTVTPNVILRNVLENPGWYTAYTPYQPEISQGRMEALLNFQTMVADLTGMEMSNASLLDEGTAAAEAMAMAHSLGRNKKSTFFVDQNTYPQTIEVLQTRAEPLGIKLSIGDYHKIDWQNTFAVYIQYPAFDGTMTDFTALSEEAHKNNAYIIAGADLLALTLFKSPGEMGADIVVGSSQRFGVPMGFGGPHAAFLATKSSLARSIPGRIVGVSKDARGNMCYRLTLQTREQHIRREKATSNICTAQVLLAVMASMYAVYHGPKGIRQIAKNIWNLTQATKKALADVGVKVIGEQTFDTLRVELSPEQLAKVQTKAKQNKVNLFFKDNKTVQFSFDETTSQEDAELLLALFTENTKATLKVTEIEPSSGLKRTSHYLTHPVFNMYHSETEMLRYIWRLQKKDLTLADSMIPLGSCTMKLNATTEMIPVTWPEFANLHPFTPAEQAEGTLQIIKELEGQLKEITGFAGMSLQPNAGSQGEYAGLMVIRKYQKERGESHRNICLIPSSAHGTNPASAVMAGLNVVVVKCDNDGNVDMNDLKQKCEAHAKDLSCLMITYPSTHGVFEGTMKTICQMIHEHGGQVYMDGANMNALVGISQPGKIGVDVSHLNLHKTFCIPHGGGGPGVGPIGVAQHLVPYLPTHSMQPLAGPKTGISSTTSAPWGSALILPISWSYIKMMGADGLKHATEMAILNANYIASRLKDHYPILYKGKQGFVAHECIIDTRPIKDKTGITVDDIAKRLMDFGFHAPTMSWPVVGTLMIEPTESESLAELDRFCDALITIKKEIDEIASGKIDKDNNPLKNAPHTAEDLVGDWDRPYSRATAFYPRAWVKERKFWVSVNRVDNAYGDKNIMCSCPPLTEYSES
ncbi:MAG: aminomethyl-transferring glycine dehydrogenase [Bdellovibrionaceae bacterium]|nr:aminomethyl-transferring glycine dehydrogenase [Pseudobdellovibrionaceae bacterium]